MDAIYVKDIQTELQKYLNINSILKIRCLDKYFNNTFCLEIINEYKLCVNKFGIYPRTDDDIYRCQAIELDCINLYRFLTQPILTDIDINGQFSYACCWGSVKTAEWLYYIDSISPIQKIDLLYAFEKNYIRFKIVEFIHGLNKIDPIEMKKKYNRRIDYINMINHFEFTKWLYENKLFDIETCVNKLFIEACALGEPSVVKWLLDLGIVDIHAENDAAFVQMIGFRNDLSYIIYDMLIDLDPNYNYHSIFRRLCDGEYHNLSLAKYLYSKGLINYSKNFFRLRGYSPEIEAWLKTIYQSEQNKQSNR